MQDAPKFLPSKDVGSNDLSLEITPQHLRSLKFCGRGGFAEVFVLVHNTKGKLAFKRPRETGTPSDISEGRRVRFS